LKLSNSTLRILALLLIFLAAGPEIGIALEMTTLLEIFGAVMFFMAFSTGARMVLIDLAIALRHFIFPAYLPRLITQATLVHVSARILVFGVWVLTIGRFVFELNAGRLW